MKDQAIVDTALNEAALIIGDYLEPGPKDPLAIINRLIEVLDNQELAAATGTKRWRLSIRIRFAREVRLNENGKDRVEARMAF